MTTPLLERNSERVRFRGRRNQVVWVEIEEEWEMMIVKTKEAKHGSLRSPSSPGKFFQTVTCIKFNINFFIPFV